MVSLPQRKPLRGRPEQVVIYGPDKRDPDDKRRCLDCRCTDAFATVVIAIVCIANKGSPLVTIIKASEAIHGSSRPRATGGVFWCTYDLALREAFHGHVDAVDGA